MGWHTILYQGCLDVAAGKLTDEPTGDALMLVHGTANFKWMAAAWSWGWALSDGDPVKIAAAQKRILGLYAQERIIGHQLGEQTCPMPHDTFHRVAHATIRKLALDHLEATVDIRRENATWWGWRLALDQAGSTPDGQVILPGCRGDGGPFSQAADAINRMYMGLPQQGAARSESWWRDPIYGLGAPSILRKLMGAGPWKIALPALPKLRLPMVGSRGKNGFNWRLESVGRESEPVISSVAVTYGAIGHHDIQFIKNWRT